jgi:RNA polymerase sigma-70 factor (ECF subfamily)
MKVTNASRSEMMSQMENPTRSKTEAEPIVEYETALSVDSGQALLEAARDDPAAFTMLYHRYVTPVYRYLYKWVGNSAEAEDLTSQVFTEVLEGLVHYRERGNFTAWLFTIARHKAIAAYRRQRPNLSLDEAEDIPGPAEDPQERVVQDEQMEQMATLFSGLDEDQRELLRLRFTASLGYANIGVLLGRSEAAVKMAIFRLLRQMHEKWEKK